MIFKMKFKLNYALIFLFTLILLQFLALKAVAIPTDKEVFKHPQLKISVFKDSIDSTVFWYLPMVRLDVDNQGKPNFLKFKRADKTLYRFHVITDLSKELIRDIAQALDIQNSSQLKPVVAKRFGIQISQFQVVSFGETVNDFDYWGNPQPVDLLLDAAQAEEFEFFFNAKPGVQANVFFQYDQERNKDYLKLELSHNEIYNAMNIKASGKYVFTRAEIESKLSNYISNKNLTIVRKGEIQLSEAVNRAIDECFMPLRRDNATGRDPYGYPPSYPPSDFALPPPTDVFKEATNRSAVHDDLLDFSEDPLLSSADAALGSSFDEPPTKQPDNGYPPPPGGDPSTSKPPAPRPEVQFVFKKELSNSNKTFKLADYKNEDIPAVSVRSVYLNESPKTVPSKFKLFPLATKDLVVEAEHTVIKPATIGINIEENTQYIITAAFTYSAESNYARGRHFYRWDSKWPNIDEELYYRIGTSAWNKVNGRVIIRSDNLLSGELQFYLDRNRIWEKIPEQYRQRGVKYFPIWPPPIFTYDRVYPQFNVVVNGHRYELIN